MKVKLIVIGKENAELMDEAFKQYAKKVNHYFPFELIAIPYLKNCKSLSIEEQKKKEGELILKKLQASDFVILLDERGMEQTSIEFSDFLQSTANTGVKTVIFIIGGAYGFSEEIYKRRDKKLALSKMTFPHIFTRLIFIEQLYRACTILKNEPYHHQ